MAVVLLLCALLLGNEVVCQDPETDTTDAPAADPAVDNSAAPPAATDIAAAPATNVAPDASAAPTPAAGDQSAGTVVLGATSLFTVKNTAIDASNQEGGTSGTTAAPSAGGNEGSAAADVHDNSHIVETVVPDVECVGKADIQESNAIKAVVETGDCETIKRIIQENPAVWCKRKNCSPKLEISHEGDTLLVASNDADLGTLAEALQSEHLKDKLGVTNTEIPSSSGSSVFVGILVTGLLAAVAITVGYFKCQRRSDTKGVRLAEEAYPVDQENQGNTLVSVAPLNPPPETQEKPSVNGESPEAAKTEAPPTNGHSTTKTADTEL